MCSELVNYVCVIISRLLLGELGQFGVGSCCLAAISVLFQLLHFCLLITAQQQAIQQSTSATKRFATTCAIQAIQGGGSAPAVSAQLGVGGQMLVAIANPIQIAPQQEGDNTDTDNVLAALSEEDDDDIQVLLL